MVGWTLHFTKSRFREMVIAVRADDFNLIESDLNSTLVTRYLVVPEGGSDVGHSLITVRTSWHGADGFIKYIERILAPAMMRKIHAAYLTNVKQRCEQALTRSSRRGCRIVECKGRCRKWCMSKSHSDVSECSAG